MIQRLKMRREAANGSRIFTNENRIMGMDQMQVLIVITDRVSTPVACLLIFFIKALTFSVA